MLRGLGWPEDVLFRSSLQVGREERPCRITDKPVLGLGQDFPLAGPSALGELCVSFDSGSLGKTRGPFRERRERETGLNTL